MDNAQRKVLVMMAEILAKKTDRSNFDKIVDLFLHMDMLGHCDSSKFSVTLYGMSTDKESIIAIQQAVDAITRKNKVIVLSPKLEHSNVNIIDIDL